MALTSGFFDSVNLDRTYNADQFSSFYDGLIIDGVYSSVGNRFRVAVSSGMQLTVDTGRAWFDHVWVANTSKYTLTISTADTVYPRIDAVIIEINKQDRKSYLKVVNGTPAANPSRPSLIKTNLVRQYALAYVTVPVNATSISSGNIDNVVGNVETPLVSFLNITGLPPMQYSETDINAGSTPLYTGTLYLVYE